MPSDQNNQNKKASAGQAVNWGVERFNKQSPTTMDSLMTLNNCDYNRDNQRYTMFLEIRLDWLETDQLISCIGLLLA